MHLTRNTLEHRFWSYKSDSTGVNELLVFNTQPTGSHEDETPLGREGFGHLTSRSWGRHLATRPLWCAHTKLKHWRGCNVWRPAYLKMLWSVLRKACVHFPLFTRFVCVCVWNLPPINQNSKVYRYNFSRLSCKLVNSHFQLCGQTIKLTLGCPLFTSFWITDCRILFQKEKHCESSICWCKGILSWTVVLSEPVPWFLTFFLLFVRFIQPHATNSIKFQPAKNEDG